jgi:hypothetical protein
MYPQGHDGTIWRVYGPPLELVFPNDPLFLLLQENSRVIIPLLRYICGTHRREWVQKPPVLFFVQESLGVGLSHALGGKIRIGAINTEGGFPLKNCIAISIRIHVGS